MKSWKSPDEWLDQLAHLAAGFLVTWVLCYLMHFSMAFTLMFMVALGRELWQHDWDIEEMGMWSWIDMLFFTIGGIIAGFA